MKQEDMLLLTKKQRKNLERIAKIMNESRMQFFIRGDTARITFGSLPISWHAPVIMAFGVPVICPSTMVSDLVPTVDQDLTISGLVEEYGDTMMRLDAYRPVGQHLVLVGEAYDGSEIEGYLPTDSVIGDVDLRECTLEALSFEKIIVKRNGRVVFTVPEEA